MSFTKNHQNTQKMIFSESQCEGEYGIPIIRPLRENFDWCEFIPFNYAKTESGRDYKGIHFYLDDYQFERLWNTPTRYINLLYDFKYVLTPDFSMYTDYPKALQVFNHYRKHWLGAYWQRHGIPVIPTIGWADKESFAWCFDGEPKNSIVSVSSVGVCQNKESIRAFMNGYIEMLDRLHPTKILFFGKPIVKEHMTDYGNIVLMENRMRSRLIELSKRGKL